MNYAASTALFGIIMVYPQGKNIENFAKELFDIAYLKGVADAEVKVQGDYWFLELKPSYLFKKVFYF